VTMMSSNEAASLLTTATTSAPPFTGSVPPPTKQFCTSTTISADLASGLMAARAGQASPATMQAAAVEARKKRREKSGETGAGMATSGVVAPSLAPPGWHDDSRAALPKQWSMLNLYSGCEDGAERLLARREPIAGADLGA